MIRRPPRSTPFPTRRSSDLRDHRPPDRAGGAFSPRVGELEVGSAGDQRPADGERLLHGGRQDGHLQRHVRSEEHTSELQSRQYLVCRLLLEKKKTSTEVRFL